ncbi:MAG: hypothetical protein J2P36_13965 [Ktedonobacteraceae bacterium]|nr:hypothetical protein [Ktedonobacteraceae bacterium]
MLAVPFCFGIAVFAFFVFLFWRICEKAGYSGALSLIALIPGIGILILLCILAFSQWPSQPMGYNPMAPTPGYAPMQPMPMQQQVYPGQPYPPQQAQPYPPQQPYPGQPYQQPSSYPPFQG